MKASTGQATLARGAARLDRQARPSCTGRSSGFSPKWGQDRTVR
jgi:hypothetical protein